MRARRTADAPWPVRPERLVPCEWSESTPLPLDARWDSDLEDVLLDDLASAWSAGHHR
ncbi:hypothetical protein ACQ4WX_48045 [Streptomyces lasalocidi]